MKLFFNSKLKTTVLKSVTLLFTCFAVQVLLNAQSSSNSGRSDVPGSFKTPAHSGSGSKILYTCTQTFTGTLSDGDETQVGRLNRNETASTCLTPKSCSTFSNSGDRFYDVYSFTNPDCANPLCVDLTFSETCDEGDTEAVVYLGTFDPTDICNNYLADGGFSTDNPPYPVSYSFEIPAGATISIVEFDVDPGGTCETGGGYQIDLSYECSNCPVIGRTDYDGDGIPDITDPCSCADPQNYMDGSGMVTYFHDFVTVTSLPGETWEVTAQAGAFSDNGATPIPTCGGCTVLPEVSPGVYRLDPIFHAPTVGYTMTVDRTAGGPSFPLMTGGTCSPCQQIPALGEWGLILLSLLILTFGVVALRSRKTVLAGAVNSTFTARNRSIPFNGAAFRKMLVIVMVSLAAVFAVAVGFFGYDMTAADVPGSLVAGAMLAYLLHLFAKNKPFWK